MVNLEVLNPVADISKTDISPAARFTDLSGKTVGLFWNGKPSGEITNQFTSEFLAKKVKNIHFKNYLGSLGSVVRQMSTEDTDTIAKECDAVVGAIGD